MVARVCVCVRGGTLRVIREQVFLAELMETARVVQVLCRRRRCQLFSPHVVFCLLHLNTIALFLARISFIFQQHEENLVRFGVFAAAAFDHPAPCEPLGDDAAAESPEPAAAAGGSACATAAAAQASGEALDEPALFLRAVAANMQAGKKVSWRVTPLAAWRVSRDSVAVYPGH